MGTVTDFSHVYTSLTLICINKNSHSKNQNLVKSFSLRVPNILK